MLTLSVPTATPDDTYVQRLEGRLTDAQRQRLLGILQGLKNANATLACEKKVTTENDAIRWLLENFVESAS